MEPKQRKAIISLEPLQSLQSSQSPQSSNSGHKTDVIDDWASEVINEKKIEIKTDDSYNIEETKDVKIIKSFDDMGLSDDILKGVYMYGFESPSFIQQKAIHAIASGHDTIVQSQSGTGKTGAFTIGSAQRVNVNEKRVQVVILSPTQPLAEQTKKVYSDITHPTKIKTLMCIGGTDINNCINEYKKGVHVIIGTPGRVWHLVSGKIIDISHTKVFILDEADEMLSMGFSDQVHNIMTHLPKKTVQLVLVSATIKDEMNEIINNIMRNPIKILIRREKLTLDGIKQYYVVHNYDTLKLDTLLYLYKKILVTQTIIYVNTIRTAEYVGKILTENEYPVGIIHGKCHDKRAILQKFKLGSVRVLISTDVLARGIDIQQVELVINFDLPGDFETYIHRIGRSGRFGKKGIAINLITKFEWTNIEAIKKHYTTNIEQLPEQFEKYIS
jgi:superfamily II DNA/RNA helicase